jgi:hypothetical protein
MVNTLVIITFMNFAVYAFDFIEKTITTLEVKESMQ